MSDLPPPAPEGVLIREARERAIPKRSIPDVAHSVGIDPGTLGNIERGYRHIGEGRRRAVTADAATLAKLARELGVSPGRLESAERPDAAKVLRDMLSDQPGAEPGLLPGHPYPARDGGRASAGPEAEFLASVLKLLRPEDQEVVRSIMGMVDGDNRPWSWERKKQEIEKYVDAAEGSERSRPAAGLGFLVHARANARTDRISVRS